MYNHLVNEEFDSIRNSAVEMKNDDRFRTVEYAEHLTALLHDKNNEESKKIVMEEMRSINRYMQEENDFPDNEFEVALKVSMVLWEESIRRSYSSSNPIRGFDIANNYIESDNIELSLRYLYIFLDKYIEPIYSYLEVDDEQVESVASEIGNEQFDEIVRYGALLVLIWHKAFGRIMTEERVDIADQYIVN